MLQVTVTGYSSMLHDQYHILLTIVIITPVNMGILIQILIQIGCVYTEANWIQIQTQTMHLSHIIAKPHLHEHHSG